jgi:excisionase family DNA binding protein
MANKKMPPLSRKTAYADLPERLTVREFVRVTGVGKATVYDGVQKGTMPAIRIGRRVLIPRTALLPESNE